jgi:MFS family permease
MFYSRFEALLILGRIGQHGTNTEHMSPFASSLSLQRQIQPNSSNQLPKSPPNFNSATGKFQFLTCFNILALGVGNLFWVPLMRVLGKRPVYLVALPILASANIWSFVTRDYKQLLASSILSGFASSAAEATVPAIVTDIFYVHERGSALMIFHLAISSGMFLEPLINSYVTQYSTWRMTCGWMAIAAGATWLLAIFTVHETSYYNREIYRPFTSFGRKHSYAEKLGMTNGYNKKETFFAVLGKSIAVLAYPSILWSGLVVGVFAGWYLPSHSSILKPY